MLTFEFRATSRLAPSELDALWHVYSLAFLATRDAFEQAVQGADEAVLYRDGGRLCGLALISVYQREHQGRQFRVIWTGSVFIEPEHRGDNAIQRSALVRLARERLRHPLTPLFWFFDTFSYKSYLLMARNFGEYWPRRDRSTPPWEQAVLASLCQERHGDLFDPARGVIAARGKRLRPGVAELPTIIHDPHLLFFAEVNPRATSGECLGCLAPLSLANLARIVLRMGERLLRRVRFSRDRAAKLQA